MKFLNFVSGALWDLRRLGNPTRCTQLLEDGVKIRCGSPLREDSVLLPSRLGILDVFRTCQQTREKLKLSIGQLCRTINEETPPNELHHDRSRNNLGQRDHLGLRVGKNLGQDIERRQAAEFHDQYVRDIQLSISTLVDLYQMIAVLQSRQGVMMLYHLVFKNSNPLKLVANHYRDIQQACMAPDTQTESSTSKSVPSSHKSQLIDQLFRQILSPFPVLRFSILSGECPTLLPLVAPNISDQTPQNIAALFKGQKSLERRCKLGIGMLREAPFMCIVHDQEIQLPEHYKQVMLNLRPAVVRHKLPSLSGMISSLLLKICKSSSFLLALSESRRWHDVTSGRSQGQVVDVTIDEVSFQLMTGAIMDDKPRTLIMRNYHQRFTDRHESLLSVALESLQNKQRIANSLGSEYRIIRMIK